MLQNSPTTVEATRIAPTTDHSIAAQSSLLQTMSQEMQRWMKNLSTVQEPIHYMSYRIQDVRSISIAAENGALIASEDDTDRQLDTEVRVGTKQLDNTRSLSRDPQGLNNRMVRRGIVPMGDDPEAIRTHLWLDTDRRYRESVIAHRQVLADIRERGDNSKASDFSPQDPIQYFQQSQPLVMDQDSWKQRLKKCSKLAKSGVATRGTCRLDMDKNTIYFVNSEGSKQQLSWMTAQLSIMVGVKANDGMQLRQLEQRFANTPASLPTDEQIADIIIKLQKDLTILHRAPIVDPYVGPAILQGRAAAVFFHEVFGHRVEGHRQKEDTSGQTFSAKVGEKIMPEWINIYDDPTIRSLNGVLLNGFYRFDDEGVMAKRVPLVEAGILKGFLQGRNPLAGFPNSNGHGRKAPGRFPVSRQGNLVVEANKTIAESTDLEKLLLQEVKRQNKPFGMVFTDISGGFTNTSRFLPQAFKVNPVMAYRLYPSGRKQAVRGVDIVGTPLTALGAIIAANKTIETFNGMCGAESGWVPVSASAPSLLIRSLEVERGNKAIDRSPILPPPPTVSHNKHLLENTNIHPKTKDNAKKNVEEN